MSELFYRTNQSDELKQYQDKNSSSGICLNDVVTISYRRGEGKIELELGNGQAIKNIKLSDRKQFFKQVGTLAELQREAEKSKKIIFVCVCDRSQKTQELVTNILYSSTKIWGFKDSTKLMYAKADKGGMPVDDQIRLVCHAMMGH